MDTAITEKAHDNGKVRRLQREYRILVTVIAVALILSNVVAFYNIGSDTPPLWFDGPPIMLTRTDLCVGDTLSYRMKLHVERPTIAVIVPSVWSVSTNQTSIFADRPIYTNHAQEIVFVDRYDWTIPEGLEPGEYIRRVGVGTLSQDTLPAILDVPFSIRTDCNK